VLVETRTLHNRPPLAITRESDFRGSTLTAADPKTRRSDVSADTLDPASGAIPLRTLSNEGAGKPGSIWPDYLEALELINGAAQAMSAMEEHSQQIQAKAFELTERARTDRLATSQQIASLEQQLAVSETRVAELSRLLADAELRAQTAQEWLQRFLETINGSLSPLRAFQRQRESNRNPSTAA
jgi:hypothetical protein